MVLGEAADKGLCGQFGDALGTLAQRCPSVVEDQDSTSWTCGYVVVCQYARATACRVPHPACERAKLWHASPPVAMLNGGACDPAVFRAAAAAALAKASLLRLLGLRLHELKEWRQAAAIAQALASDTSWCACAAARHSTVDVSRWR